MNSMRRFFLIAACLAMAACASYSPTSLPLGSTQAAAVQDMGPPTEEFPLPDGGRRLEFARGPYGKHTFMLDFDAQGKLVRSEQVLTEANFGTIRAGMDQTELRAKLGRPSEYMGYGWTELFTAWSYRFDSPFCQWFQVGVNAQGKVVDSAYGIDPICDRRDTNAE